MSLNETKIRKWPQTTCIFINIRGYFEISVFDTSKVDRTSIQRRLLYRGVIWPRGYKTFFILNSVEREILSTFISMKISRNSAFFRLR